MSKECFRDKKFSDEKLAKIALCDTIIANYQKQGLRLTLRQLYYQPVTRNAITNEERSYKNLGTLVSDARLAGLLDWDAIEDRVRQPRVSPQWDSVADLVESAARQFRLPRWEGQEAYVELWVEKDALAGVLQPIARQFHVTMMVNRGYSSQSAMYEAAQRFIDHGRERSVLFYLGDHDPSGEDMVRDVRDRLEMFGVQDLEVQKLALTMDQVEEYDPPPNPAKVTDSRAAKYIEEHGDSSWEVDALPPNVLTEIIEEAIRGVVDEDLVEAVLAREEIGKAQLRAAAKKIDSKIK